MCVPGPGLLAEEGPMAWPGRVRVGVDIVVLELFFGCCGVVEECSAMRCDAIAIARYILGKVESDVCAGLGFR